MIRAALRGGGVDVAGAAIYGVSLICLYTMSSVYHGLRPGMGKKVMQVLDHCTIYFLIAGSYTPVALSAIRPVDPALGIGLVIFQWALTALAVTLTAVDLRNYRVFSMICYIAWVGHFAFVSPGCSSPGPDRLSSAARRGHRYTAGAVLYGCRRPQKMASLGVSHFCGFGQRAAISLRFFSTRCKAEGASGAKNWLFGKKIPCNWTCSLLQYPSVAKKPRKTTHPEIRAAGAAQAVRS